MESGRQTPVNKSGDLPFPHQFSCLSASSETRLNGNALFLLAGPNGFGNQQLSPRQQSGRPQKTR